MSGSKTTHVSSYFHSLTDWSSVITPLKLMPVHMVTTNIRAQSTPAKITLARKFMVQTRNFLLPQKWIRLKQIRRGTMMYRPIFVPSKTSLDLSSAFA